jgi:hypothetical protein
MEIRRVGSQPSGKGPAEYFTGTVRIASPGTLLTYRSSILLSILGGSSQGSSQTPSNA